MGYLLLLTALSARLPSPKARGLDMRFDVIVPAHNEAAVIARTVHSLRSLAWAPECWRLTVVADNCTDETAGLAAGAGATVLERHNLTLRGKGYALAHAFERSVSEGWANAVVVVDADTTVSPNLLAAYAARLAAGADAVQAHYGVLNPNVSWRTQLMTVAMECFHGIRSRARERLGVSCGIRGNGWCVSRRALEVAPYRAYSLAEDVEYGAELALAGIRVHYAAEAAVLGEMVSNAEAAAKQRERWEGGRFELIRRFAPRLIRAAWRQKSAVCADLALDLMIPPLTYLVALVLLFDGSSLWLYVLDARFAVWPGAAVVATLAVAIYVARGWQLSGIGWAGLSALGRVPVFLAWRVLLLFRWRKPATWNRTDREPR